jgi:hypothetical protein
MNVEIVHRKMPFRRRGIACYRLPDVPDKISFRPRRADRRRHDLAGHHLEIDDERQRPVPDVFELPALDFPRPEREPGMLPLQGLDPSQLVGGKDPFPGGRAGGGFLIERAEIFNLGLALRRWLVGSRRQPVTDPVRFQIRLFLKSVPHADPRSARKSRASLLRR